MCLKCLTIVKYLLQRDNIVHFVSQVIKPRGQMVLEEKLLPCMWVTCLNESKAPQMVLYSLLCSSSCRFFSSCFAGTLRHVQWLLPAKCLEVISGGQKTMWCWRLSGASNIQTHAPRPLKSLWCQLYYYQQPACF